MLGATVGGEIGITRKSFGEETGGQGVERPGMGAICELDALGGVPGSLGSIDDGFQTGVDGGEARVGDAELVEFFLGVCGLVGPPRAFGGRDQIGQMVGERTPIRRVVRVDRKGLACQEIA